MWVELDFPVTGTVRLDGTLVHGTVISRDPQSRELWLLTDGADAVVAIHPDEFTPDERQKALSLLGE